MIRRDRRRGRVGYARIALALLAILAFWPSFHGAAAPVALAEASPLRDTIQPAPQDLQAAFDLAGRGLLPAGYPQSADGWLVPPSLLKAVAWTESKWRQFDAPHHTLLSYDGGVGIMQITSGMEPDGLTQETQSAIRNNFLFNIAYGAQVLITKLLLTPNIGNDDPSILEHWYYALWAYNGWGWANNPNNPAFTRIGTPATHPDTWPYQERVFYWLAHPPRGPGGAPLWPAIPVSLPEADQIGANPGPLPEVAAPHADVSVPSPGLNLGTRQDAAFVADLSMPDGQVVQPGQHFRKVWELLNRGDDVWGPGCRWVPVSGPPMGDAAGVPVPMTAPLADVAVGADLVAPAAPGTYREYWQMVDPAGHPFGVRAWVAIRVAGQGRTPVVATPTAGGLSDASATGDAPAAGQATLRQQVAGTPSAHAQATAGPTSTTGDAAVYAGDVSVPDGTVFRPGERFVKTWRIRNIGTTYWTAAYHWRFEAGTLMSSTLAVPAPPTAPGGTAIISVPMVAPTSTGVYTSFWQMTNASGRAFPHQAWVNIVVSGRSVVSTPARATPAATIATATPTATTPASTPVPAAPPQPTVSIPGGGGQLIASPWVGALTFRTFFAAGATDGNNRESIGIYYPGVGVAHVRVTLYRPDSAQRMLEFALQSGGHRILALNRIAPGTGLAVTVEADRLVVAQRVAADTSGVLADPGAARTARVWLFPSIPDGAPPAQRLLLFNPHDQPATVSIKVGLPRGGCCASESRIRVPPLQQFVYDLGTAPALRGPLTLFASDVVAAERLALTQDGADILGIPGTVVGATHWYIPYVRSDKYGGVVTVFNPSSQTVTATVRVALDEGAGGWQQRSVPPFSQIEVPVSSMAAALSAAAVVDATGPVVAEAVHFWGTGQPTVSMGSSISTRAWTIIAGLAGRGFSESLDLLNPSARACIVDVQVLGSRGPVGSWSLQMPAHSRYSRLLGTVLPAGGGVLMIKATQPITAGRTVSGNAGSASSPGFPLQS